MTHVLLTLYLLCPPCPQRPAEDLRAAHCRWGWTAGLASAPPASCLWSEPAGGRHAVPTQTSGCCPTAVVDPPLKDLAGTHLHPNPPPAPAKGAAFIRKREAAANINIFINIISLILVISTADSHFTHGKTEAQGGHVARLGSHGRVRNSDKALGSQK